MKKFCVVFFGILFSVNTINSQSWRYFWWEGELGGVMDVVFTDLNRWQISPSGSIAARYKFHKFTSAKLQVAAGQISGIDDRDTVIYSYSTILIAPSLRFEYELYRSEKDLPGYNSRGLDMDLRKYWVYLFGGIGMIYFDPQPGDDLPEEEIKKYTWILPFGAGFKYNFSRSFSVGAEVGISFTGSDYLEGYSPDTSGRNDKFLKVGVLVAYKFGTTPSSSFRVR
ncbi:MAG: hypothetical protein JSV24_12025 [Bacteroidales bacterium]|nr:MAG: hypothetical protein JSV24_12025 [Bacteroidales bacterium]